MAEFYGTARPPYPARVHEVLVERCGLRPGIRVLDVGAGSGQATLASLRAGARVVAVEPGPSLADKLRGLGGPGELEVIVAAFEDAGIPEASFDLVTIATAFHWLDPNRSLAKIHGALRPGGWIAMWWNVFGDPSEPDAFHEATSPLFEANSPSPSTGYGTPFGLDVPARLGELIDHGFEDVTHEVIRWDLVLDAVQARRLYATFSNIARLPPEKRDDLLDGIERTAREAFSNRVVRRMATPLYTARRPAEAAG